MEPVSDPGDPRLDPYRHLTDAGLRRAYEEGRGLFLAEGELVVRHALRLGAGLVSVLVSERRFERMRDVLADAPVPVLVASQEVLNAVAGFDIHRGAIACVARPAPVALDAVASDATRLLVVEAVNDHENLGVLFRNAAALGADGVVLDPTCADPLYRRSVRVSMGHVLSVPWCRADSWPAALHALRDAGFVVAALSPAGPVELAGAGLASEARVAVLVGAEGPGLSAAALAASTVIARIPMAPGVDSLNVAAAAAIALYAVRPG